ncbi:MAG: hypothetical protein ABI946_04895 [Chthoniobacterales bacterium]
MHTTVCVILAGAYLRCGWSPIWEVAPAKHFGPILPFHSTNSYFLTLTSRPDGSERLMRVLSGLAIAVIYREGEESDIFLAFMVAYFAWPREARAVPVDRSNVIARLDALDSESLSAVFYCGMAARPSNRPIVRIGDGLIMEPRSKGLDKP